MDSLDQQNIFSCDVEDWYQSSYDFEAPISKRVYTNVQKCLRILDGANVRGTFFVQGLVAEERPEVVKLIDEAGHEVASHGHSHKPVYSMSHSQFFEDLSTSINRIEEITGKKVRGYRAPDFSIFNNTKFAFDVLQECGIEYDSSMFPMRTKRYGNPGCPISPFRVKGSNLIEFPMSVYSRYGVKIPVAGGGYLRLLPISFVKHSIRSINADGMPFVLYCHPYEFDPEEWQHMNGRISMFRRTHQGLGRNKIPYKINSLLKEFRFTSFEEKISVIQDVDLLTERSLP
jgi:polysaccharide deacetylase family protein (PEP-CTERM system associated)